MTQWWPYFISDQAARPWDTWFWEKLPGGETVRGAWGWPGWIGERVYYWFRKISPSGGHLQQLAIKSPVAHPWIAGRQTAVKANVVYILTYPNDTPNWGNPSSLVAISPPCGNWVSNLYEAPESVTRSQTWTIRAAIKAERELPANIVAAIGKTESLPCSILAAIQGDAELPHTIKAGILGDAELPHPIRAAIRGEVELNPSIVAAVGKDFSLPLTIGAYIQGNPEKHVHIKAAIRGDTEIKHRIIAYVVKSRVNQILLEWENLWPQECDLRSTPNSPSQFRDWRKSKLGE